jgi:hypothetical protein
MDEYCPTCDEETEHRKGKHGRYCVKCARREQRIKTNKHKGL